MTGVVAFGVLAPGRAFIMASPGLNGGSITLYVKTEVVKKGGEDSSEFFNALTHAGEHRATFEDNDMVFPVLASNRREAELLHAENWKLYAKISDALAWARYFASGPEIPSPKHYSLERAVDGIIDKLKDVECSLSAASLVARDRLRFKDYVHGRLDEAGIETDPESSHKAEGCRIGGRLDILICERNILMDKLRELIGNDRIDAYLTEVRDLVACGKGV